MNKIVSMLLLFISALLFTACSSISEGKIRESCESSIKSYNKMIRWHEIENAGMLFTKDEARDLFMKKAESLKKRGVSITDFRILLIECLPEKRTATSLVEFDFYELPSNRVNTVTDRQKWQFEEQNDDKQWRIKTALPEFEQSSGKKW